MERKIKILIGAVVLLVVGVFAVFFISAKTASRKTEVKQEKQQIKGIVFSSVSVSPNKTKIGDIQTTTVSLESGAGIKSVAAQIPFEGSYDEVALKLISGDDKKGVWQGQWKDHNTLTKEYTTKIIAIDKNNKIATTTVTWWDDTDTVWYDQNWTNRKQVTVHENSGSTLSNYQVPVDLTTAFYNNTGLVGSWHFNDGSGSVAKDSSGNNNNGAIQRSNTWTTDIRGRATSALSFDGNNDYVSVIPNGTTLDITNNMTVAAWINITTKSQQRIVTRNWANNGSFIFWKYSNGLLYFETKSTDGAEDNSLFSDINMPTGTWVHVVATMQSSPSKIKSIYINGVLHGSKAFTSDITINVGNLLITGTGSLLQGSMDDVRLYNRALSATEVAALYTEGKARPDLDDLRFTAANGKTLLPYWIENDSKAWVKVPTLTGSADTNIYYYYGNKNAATASSDTNTFVRVVNNLVLGWNFNEGSGTVIYDRSANSNNGGVQPGATFATDRRGNASSAINVDGASGYVSAASSGSLNPSSQITMEAWVNISPGSTQYSTILGKSYDNTSGWDFRVTSATNTTTTDITFRVNGNAVGSPPVLTLNNGTWYYLVATYDGSKTLVYENSVLSGTYNHTGSINSTISSFAVGKESAHTWYSAATVDDVHIYNRALTAAEVSDLYNANYDTIIAPNEVLVSNYVSSVPTISATANEESRPNEIGVGVSGGVLMF